MSTPSIQYPPQPQKKDIWSKSFFVQISKGQPSRTRALPREFIQVQGADVSRLHGSKDLYKSDIFKRLDKNEAKLDATLDLLCFPFPLQKGTRIVPMDMLNEVDKLLLDHVKVRNAIIAEFKEKVPNTEVFVYDQLVLESKQYLGNAFNPADYPPLEVFIARFRFEWNIMDMSPAEQLKSVKKEYYEREAEKLAKKWEEAGEAAQKLLRASMAGMVTHLVDRLSDEVNSEGKQKRKIFRDTVMDPITEFLRTFEARNITDDKELEKLVSQTRQLVSGVRPELLREYSELRSSTERGFQKIKNSLDQLLIDAPSRVIRFED